MPWARARRLDMVCVAVLAAACNNPAPAAHPSVLPASPFSGLPGRYALTISVDDTCGGLLSGLNSRTYQAVVEDRGWHFAPVIVSGGGFTEPAPAAEFWAERFIANCPTCNAAVAGETRFAFAWNGYIGGGAQCNHPERLTSSSELHLCGTGVASQHGTALSGYFAGPVSVYTNNIRGMSCTGTHRFVFVRTPD